MFFFVFYKLYFYLIYKIGPKTGRRNIRKIGNISELFQKHRCQQARSCNHLSEPSGVLRAAIVKRTTDFITSC